MFCFESSLLWPCIRQVQSAPADPLGLNPSAVVVVLVVVAAAVLAQLAGVGFWGQGWLLGSEYLL